MKTVNLLLATTALVACTSHQANVVSTNTSELRLGDKPQGYPRTYVTVQNGNCTQVIEDWVDNGSSNGKKMWVVAKSIKPVVCQ
jgi:hypothetical protein